MRKQIYINNEPTIYEIDEYGTLYNNQTNKILKGCINGNYKIYTLRHNNKSLKFRAHRLVAEYFLSNPDNLPIVDHINGDTLDNNVSNLQWVSYEDNSKNKHQHTQLSSIEYNESNEDIWKPYRNSCYLISQTGKIKNKKTNKMLKGTIDQYGYIAFNLKNTINKFTLLHRAVWECFGGNLIDGLVINHKDGNKLNNHINNLEQISPKQNIQHMLQEIHPNLSTQIYQYDKKGNLINIYPSINECGRQLNEDSRHIAACVNNKQLFYKNWFFVKSQEQLQEKLKLWQSHRCRTILQYDLNGQLLREFKSIQEAVDAGYGSYSNINNCLCGKYKTANGYKWKRI